MNKNPPWRHSPSNPHCRPEFLQDINLEAPFLLVCGLAGSTTLDPTCGGDCLFVGKNYTNWAPNFETPVFAKQIMLVISSYGKKLKVPSVRACFPRPLACCRPVAAWAWWKRFPWKSSILRCLGLLHAVNCRTKLDSHLKFGRCNGFYLIPRKYFWFVVLVVSVIFNVAYLLHLDWPAPKTELPCPTLLKNLQVNNKEQTTQQIVWRSYTASFLLLKRTIFETYFLEVFGTLDWRIIVGELIGSSFYARREIQEMKESKKWADSFQKGWKKSSWFPKRNKNICKIISISFHQKKDGIISMGIIIDYEKQWNHVTLLPCLGYFFDDTPDRLSNGGGSESKSKIQVPCRWELTGSARWVWQKPMRHRGVDGWKYNN